MNTRVQKLLPLLKKHQADCLFVNSVPNVTYLSGFRGDDSYLLVTPKKSFFITDSRYGEQARKEIKGFEIIVRNGHSVLELVNLLTSKTKCRRIGFEAQHLPYAFYSQLSKGLTAAKRLVGVSRSVESLRMIKDRNELKRLRESVRIAAKGVRHVRPFFKPGVKELEAVAELEHYTKAQGSEKPAFDIIIAAGRKSSMPHARTNGHRIVRDDMVLLDMGVVYEGYHSDLTRCFFTGKIPLRKKEIYKIVLSAQERAIEKVRPGIQAREIDAACRDYIKSRGYGRYFGHGTGHGVGLQIHEEPYISPRSSQILKPGMVITVEPGIYLPNQFGVRIEDMVLVTEKGFEVLTKDISKNLV